MGELRPSDFRKLFLDLHNKTPFPWQERLAEQVCAGEWPQVIDLPTASGKTACIDIALFALALGGEAAPRRIFFVVDRRVVVNEAYERVKGIASRLESAREGVLKQVADSLRALAGGGDPKPLETYEMRGGVYRDESWVKTPLQPIVVASTVDQVGSRLLFRGYGVNENSWPIHAGLIANDALIFLDEAHCSRAFAQTLEAIERYRSEAWAETPIRSPFHFVEMTATPSRSNVARRFVIDDADRRDDELKNRLYTSKLTTLAGEVKGKKGDFGNLADKLVEQAIAVAKEAQATRIAVMVNRVQTAKLVHKRLLEKKIASELVIGRMRPIDRDVLSERLKPLKSGEERLTDAAPIFVISTQCLEVGADLDFDVLVTECASIDALLQRFGRLDRLGRFRRALGRIVIGSWQVDPKEPDPVYGTTLSTTWKWLKGLGAEIDMGIESEGGEAKTVAEHLKAISTERQAEMRLVGEGAPVLLPAHLDALVQTSPQPTPEPLVKLFLHGPERGVPDVQVVWRADLEEANDDKWPEIVSMCPPVSTEAMPVRMWTFCNWLAGRPAANTVEADIEGVRDEMEEIEQDERARKALLWSGGEGKVIEIARKVKPGQTFVLPVAAGGWEVFGHIPSGANKDVGDQAAFKMRRSVSLRLQPLVMEEWPNTPSRKELLALVRLDTEAGRLFEALDQYRLEMGANWPAPFFDAELTRLRFSAYPNGNGYALEGRKRHRENGKRREGPVFLDEHLRDVEMALDDTMSKELDPQLQESLRVAARFHDYGKADKRFQTLLRGGDAMAAHFAPRLIAKSGYEQPKKRTERELPEGFRHELLSLMFADKIVDKAEEARELALHLVASHHGRCRPFAPVVIDAEAECVSCYSAFVCDRERRENAPHQNFDVPDRFWRLTRQYGWWGLAYLEGLLRLADWMASDREDAEVSQ